MKSVLVIIIVFLICQFTFAGLSSKVKDSRYQSLILSFSFTKYRFSFTNSVLALQFAVFALHVFCFSFTQSNYSFYTPHKTRVYNNPKISNIKGLTFLQDFLQQVLCICVWQSVRFLDLKARFDRGEKFLITSRRWPSRVDMLTQAQPYKKPGPSCHLASSHIRNSEL